MSLIGINNFYPYSLTGLQNITGTVNGFTPIVSITIAGQTFYLTASTPDVNGNVVLTLNIATATTSTTGLLTDTDWNTFNSKENVLTFNSPITRSTNTIGFDFSTTNNWTGTNDFFAAVHFLAGVRMSALATATTTDILYIDGTGILSRGAVPTPTNLLPLNNTWTGTNDFNGTHLSASGRFFVRNNNNATDSIQIYRNQATFPSEYLFYNNSGTIGINDGAVNWNIQRSGVANFNTVNTTNINIATNAGITTLNDSAIRLRQSSDPNHYLQFNTSIDGPRLAGFAGVEFGSQQTANYRKLIDSTRTGPLRVYRNHESFPLEFLQLSDTGSLSFSNSGVDSWSVTRLGSAFVRDIIMSQGGAVNLTNTLEFGRQVSGKEFNAGKIGYQTFSSNLDIVGAGVAFPGRKVRIWDQLGINVDPTGVGDSLTVNGPSFMNFTRFINNGVGNSWIGAIFSRTNRDAVVAGFLGDITNGVGATIGGHNTTLGAWADFHIQPHATTRVSIAVPTGVNNMNQNSVTIGGAANSNGMLHIRANNALANNVDCICTRNFNDLNHIINFQNINGANQGRIRGTSTVSVVFESASDRRLKKNIRDMESMIGKIKKMEPVFYEFHTDEYSDYGFIAQDIFKVFPHMRPKLGCVASYCKCGCEGCDEVNCKCDCDNFDWENPIQKDGSMYTYALDYGRFTPFLTKALQEVIVKVETLEDKIETLEDKIETLEDKIETLEDENKLLKDIIERITKIEDKLFRNREVLKY
jgi:hypothetical protein